MKRKRHAKILRIVRKIHRTMGIFLFLFFIVVALSGLLLGWKKNIHLLQEPTKIGLSGDAAKWLSLQEISTIAKKETAKRWGADISLKIDKLDLRPDKGIVKIIFADHFHSLQIDLTSGEVLSHEYRSSDLIEQLHDGSVVDRMLNLSGGVVKLFYTTLLSLALLSFSVTGFWLWYGPVLMRKSKRKHTHAHN